MRISDWSSDVCSSDLIAIIASHDTVTVLPEPLGPMTSICPKGSLFPGSDMSWNTKLYGLPVAVRKIVTGLGRSEEHTSELQSLMRISYAVFCLKKKRAYNKIKTLYKEETTQI